MEIQIKFNGRPLNVVGPLFPFSWFDNLKVVAEKQDNIFVVSKTEVVEKMRKKDPPYGDKFADFFNDPKSSEIEKFVFDSDSVIVIN